MWHAQVRGTQDVELEFSDIKLAGQVCCHPSLQWRLSTIHKDYFLLFTCNMQSVHWHSCQCHTAENAKQQVLSSHH